jgi:hypothetical protein
MLGAIDLTMSGGSELDNRDQMFYRSRGFFNRSTEMKLLPLQSFRRLAISLFSALPFFLLVALPLQADQFSAQSLASRTGSGSSANRSAE